MSISFWRYLVVVLQTQTFRQFVTGLIVVTLTAAVLSLLDDSVRWSILPILVAFFTCSGIGVDLHGTKLSIAVIVSLASATIVSLVMALIMQGIDGALHRTSRGFPVITAMEIILRSLLS